MSAAAIKATASALLLRDMSESEYHSDPCETPSLSASIANVLHTQSPLHAYHLHPRLGGHRRPPTASMDAGSLAHLLLLGTGSKVEVIVADDWRTKAAKAARDEARAAGKIPVLVEDHDQAAATADALRARFDEHGIKLYGQSEVSVFWREGSVQCRGRIDHVNGLEPDRNLIQVLDLKSIKSADPDTCRRHIDTYGYAIQQAAYTRALAQLCPWASGRIDFVFVFFELEPPHAVTPLRLSGAFFELGERRWERAVRTWERCLSTGVWPGYEDGVGVVEPPPWAMARDMERQIQEGEAA